MHLKFACADIKIDKLDGINETGFAAKRQMKRGYSRSRIIFTRVIKAYLIQVTKTVFFHADPHPGNLASDVDESLIYYDFGMMWEIKSFTRAKIMDFFHAIYEKDAKKVFSYPNSQVYAKG